jgi:hypothetical protein
MRSALVHLMNSTIKIPRIPAKAVKTPNTSPMYFARFSKICARVRNQNAIAKTIMSAVRSSDRLRSESDSEKCGLAFKSSD